MRIFVTGATGFVGSALVAELIHAGHQVLGLTRSEAGAQSLRAAGAEVHRGSVQDADCLRAGVAASDGVVHTAFDHDFLKFVANCESDRQVIESIGAALAGTGRPLVVTSAIGVVKAVSGRPAMEEDPVAGSATSPRSASEEAAAAVAARGVNVSVVRLPQVHDTVRQGLVTELVKLAREKGVSAFVGEGRNRWSAAHIGDVVRLYRLALEKQQAGAVYHAVAEAGVPFRDIAQVVGSGLKVPVVSVSAEEAAGHFGWLNKFAGLDMQASGARTQELLRWHPGGPGLIADLERMQYDAR